VVLSILYTIFKSASSLHGIQHPQCKVFSTLNASGIQHPLHRI
jgi:hypothetical protein